MEPKEAGGLWRMVLTAEGEPVRPATPLEVADAFASHYVDRRPPQLVVDGVRCWVTAIRVDRNGHVQTIRVD